MQRLFFITNQKLITMKSKATLPVFSLLILSTLLVLTACDDMIIGSGNVIKETREAKSFDAIVVSGAFTIYLYQGDDESLVIEADDNLMQYIESGVRGGKLYLDTKRFGFRSSTVKVYITIRDLEKIEVSGAVKIYGQTPIDFERLRIGISGAADLDLELFGEELELNISGAGKSHLTGEVDKATIELSGASKLNAETMYTRLMNIEISGAGTANVNVEEKLVASISGAGNVRYIGDPSIQSNISGAGKVSRYK
jgi:hypothetical protein